MKAGALIGATVVAATIIACEGPMGPAGRDGIDGIDGKGLNVYVKTGTLTQSSMSPEGPWWDIIVPGTANSSVRTWVDAYNNGNLEEPLVVLTPVNGYINVRIVNPLYFAGQEVDIVGSKFRIEVIG